LLSTQERWNPEVANIFGAAARYCRATVGSSHDDTHPDNSALHTGKIFSLPLNISRFVLILLRKHGGAAETALGGKCDADNIVNDTHVQKLDQRPQQKG
jgi:hypothetical protein